MKLYNVNARDIPDAWFQLVDLCYKEGRNYKVGEGSYAGSQFRRELDYVTCHIKFPQSRPLLPEVPAGLGIPDPVPEGMDYIDRYLPYLMTDEIKKGEQYTYGQRLMCKLGKYAEDMSQVEEVIEKFKRGFGNNQACMTIAQPGDIHLTDPPCLRQIDCRVYPRDIEKTVELSSGAKWYQRDCEQLHFIIYFRSWDLWGGFPANLAAIAHLQEYMAAEIGITPGEFIVSSKGLHLYDMYWELAKIRLAE